MIGGYWRSFRCSCYSHKVSGNFHNFRSGEQWRTGNATLLLSSRTFRMLYLVWKSFFPDESLFSSLRRHKLVSVYHVGLVPNVFVDNTTDCALKNLKISRYVLMGFEGSSSIMFWTCCTDWCSNCVWTRFMVSALDNTFHIAIRCF